MGTKFSRRWPRKPAGALFFRITWTIWTSRSRTSGTNCATSIPSRICRRITSWTAATTKSASKCRTTRATRCALAVAISRAPTPTCLRHRTLPGAPRSNPFLKAQFRAAEFGDVSRNSARNIAQQDGVGIRVPACNAEPRPVFRIGKFAEFFGRKVGELPPRRSIQRLNPQIIDTFFPYSVQDCFSGRCKGEAGQPAGIEFERRFFPVLDRVQNEDTGVIRVAHFECGDGFSLGGQRVRFGGRLDDCFGRTPVDGDALEEMILGGVNVVQPL